MDAAHTITSTIMDTIPILTEYNKLRIWEYATLLTGFDDANETYDQGAVQTKLDEKLESLRGDRSAFTTWRNDILIPVRNFITAFWFPTVRALRSEEASEMVWYERRFSFIKLAVLAMHFERFNWRHFDGNEHKEPTFSDMPQALLSFCIDTVRYGIDGWPALRDKMSKFHLDRCSAIKSFIDRHYCQ
jgi:hypothetical protein